MRDAGESGSKSGAQSGAESGAESGAGDGQVAAVLARHAGRAGALLPILHDLQEAFGHVPPAAHGPVCAALHITRAELAGVLSFYPDFRTAPGGAQVLRLCRAEACQAMGAEALAAEVMAALGGAAGAARAGVTLEPVYCLGLCACAPAAMAGDRLIGRATARALLDPALWPKSLPGALPEALPEALAGAPA